MFKRGAGVTGPNTGQMGRVRRAGAGMATGRWGRHRALTGGRFDGGALGMGPERTVWLARRDKWRLALAVLALVWLVQCGGVRDQGGGAGPSGEWQAGGGPR